MESYDESSEPKKSRVNWKDHVVKTFLECCLHEMTINGIQGSSLRMHSWNNVAETLKNTHNFIVNQRQMKNQYDYLRAKYVVWSRLRNKTGNVYNPVTNTFNLSEEEWKAEAKLSKFADKLRNAPLLYPQLCMQIFDGKAATGTGTWGPWTDCPNPSRVANISNNSLLDDDQELDSTQAPPISTQVPQIPTQVPSNSTQECSSRSQTRKRKANQPLVREEELAHVVTHVKTIFDKPSEDGDIDACITKLEKLGWEGSPLYDITLFLFSKDASYRKIWLRLKDERYKYYLCDAAYPNTRGFLTPYRNTRYWLADFRRRRAVTKEEKFNHAHAQLRNVIERAYGVLKARFPILKQMASYPYPKQIEIVVACFAIHNFIRRCNIQDQLFMEYDEGAMFTAEEQHGGGIEEEVIEVHWGASQDNGYMANLRDQIATQLFSNASI